MQGFSKKRPSVGDLFDALLCLRRSQEAIREYECGRDADCRIWLDAANVVDADAAGVRSRLVDRADGWRGLDHLRAEEAPVARARLESEIECLLTEGAASSWWLPAPPGSECWAVSFDGEWWAVPEWIDAWEKSRTAAAEGV